MLKYLFALTIILMLIALRTLKNKMSKGILFILKTVLIVFLLEVTIFNINSYRTDFGKLKYIDYYGENLNKNVSKTTNNTQYISLDNLNTNVKSIYLELDGLEEKQVVDYDIFYSDESTSKRYLASKNYFQGVDKTKYSVISLSRKM